MFLCDVPDVLSDMHILMFFSIISIRSISLDSTLREECWYAAKYLQALLEDSGMEVSADVNIMR